MYDVKELRRRRKALGLYQTEIAGELGLTNGTICSWETEMTRPLEVLLKEYNRVLMRYEHKGRVRAPRYDSGIRQHDSQIEDSEHVAVLRKEYKRLGLAYTEVNGMLGLRHRVIRRKIEGKRRMTIKESTQLRNLFHRLSQGEVRMISSEDIKQARQMLKYYVERWAKWQAVNFQADVVRGATDCSAQRYGAFPQSGGSHSDPVVRRYMRLESLKKAGEMALSRVQPLIEEYQAMKNSEDETDREMFLILERFYAGKESIEEIASSLRKSVRTMYRRKYELVRRIARKIEEGRRENGRKNA